MLEIQKWLRQNNFNYPLLEEQFGIKTNPHPTDGRIIFNYDQIASYKMKTNEIVREARGLVLDSQANLVARAFRRFFNLNEINDPFDWNNFTAFEKCDGSLCIIYYWNNSWHINTRNSYSIAKINNSSITWRELIESALPKDWKETFSPGLTYIGEICSRYNKVVRDYPAPTFFLLSLFSGEDEICVKAMLDHAKTLNLQPSPTVQLSSITELEAFLEQKEKEDFTYEGLVVRDKDNNRIKCKNKSYVRLHRVFSCGEPKTEVLLEIILKGEEGEVLTYWPEYTKRIKTIKTRYNNLYKQIDNLWYCFGDLENRKRFAEMIKTHKLSCVLFNLKDNKGTMKELFDKAIMKRPELLEKK